MQEASKAGASRLHQAPVFERDIVAHLHRASIVTLEIIMPIAMQHESDNLYRFEIRGTLRKAELEQCQAELAVQMGRIGPVRLLFVLEGFEGWDNQDNWSDLSFYMTHGQAIERIAIVGDERWRSETLMFVGADLRKAPVEFFPEQAVSDARAWLRTTP